MGISPEKVCQALPPATPNLVSMLPGDPWPTFLERSILCVRVAVLTAVTLTVPIVLFPVSW